MEKDNVAAQNSTVTFEETKKKHRFKFDRKKVLKAAAAAGAALLCGAIGYKIGSNGSNDDEYYESSEEESYSTASDSDE